MTNNRKVLFFLPPSVGGAERVTVTISKLMLKADVEVRYIIIGKNKGEILNFIPNTEKVIFIKASNIWDFVTCKIINIIRKEKPTHVFSSLHFLSIRVIIASKLFRNVKSVIRSDNYLSAYRKSSRMQMKCIYPMANKIIAQQEEMQQEIIDHYVGDNMTPKVMCIHNPIDTDTIDCLRDAASPYNQNNEVRYVWTARYHRVKGQDVLLKAFKLLREKVSNAHLYLVGKIEDENPFVRDVKIFIERNGLDDCVHMVGFDKNPYRWVVNADCFVLPSRLEGLPNSLIDAMYLGRPVVATRCIPIISRIVKDGYNGILVDSEDYISMAKAMADAIKLKDFKPTYKPSSIDELNKIFD